MTDFQTAEMNLSYQAVLIDLMANCLQGEGGKAGSCQEGVQRKPHQAKQTGRRHLKSFRRAVSACEAPIARNQVLAGLKMFQNASAPCESQSLVLLLNWKACGISSYSVAVFHLASHAFFKALWSLTYV